MIRCVRYQAKFPPNLGRNQVLPEDTKSEQDPEDDTCEDQDDDPKPIGNLVKIRHGLFDKVR